MYNILLPWQTANWDDIQIRLNEPFTTIVDMDARMSAISNGKIVPKQVTTLLNRYFEQNLITQDEFINKIAPLLRSLVLNGPRTFRGRSIRALTLGRNQTVMISRPQIATLIACIWFGLFDYSYVDNVSDFPEPTFINIFTSGNLFAISCLIEYFMRVYTIQHSDEFTQGNVIYLRNRASTPNWSASSEPLCEILIGEGRADDTPAKMHICSCSQFIGSTINRNTQEEIALFIRPECIISMLICAKLGEDALIVAGAEKMSQYEGLGAGLKFAGQFIDSTPRPHDYFAQTATIFIDASQGNSGESQFMKDFGRDLNKAYCGLSALQFSSTEFVAAPHWTHVNISNMQVKFIQLLLAASQSRRTLIYHPMGRDFEAHVIPFIDWLAQSNLTVSVLYERYSAIINRRSSGARFHNLNIFDCLMNDYN